MSSRDPETLALIVEGRGRRTAHDVDAAMCLTQAFCIGLFAHVSLFASEPGTSLGDTVWRAYIPPNIEPKVCVTL